MEAEVLRESVQDRAEVYGPNDNRAALAGAVLLSEWVDQNGESWFTFVTTDARGEALPSWRARGYLDECRNSMDMRSLRATLEEDDEDI